MAAIQAATMLPRQWRSGLPGRQQHTAGFAAAAAAARRRPARLRPAVASLRTAEPSLITLPVFPLSNVLHPAQQGMLKGAGLPARGCRSALFRQLPQVHPVALSRLLVLPTSPTRSV